MKFLRTWKNCTDEKLNAIYRAVKAVTKELYPQYFVNCEYCFFVNSSKKCLGKCVYDYRMETVKKVHGKIDSFNVRNKTVVILLSRYVTDEKDVLRTLIHEFAHAVTPFENHSATWRKRAESIGERFGETNFRAYCKSDERARFYESSGNVKRKTKYAVRCENCGSVAQRERLCKLITHPERYRCAKCGGKFKRIY